MANLSYHLSKMESKLKGIFNMVVDICAIFDLIPTPAIITAPPVSLPISLRGSDFYLPAMNY